MYNPVLVVCRPRNNGGDGLVAIRYLHYFGFRPFVRYLKCTSKPLYSGLVKQVESLSLPFFISRSIAYGHDEWFWPHSGCNLWFLYPRPPFDDLIQRLVCLRAPRKHTKISCYCSYRYSIWMARRGRRYLWWRHQTWYAGFLNCSKAMCQEIWWSTPLSRCFRNGLMMQWLLAWSDQVLWPCQLLAKMENRDFLFFSDFLCFSFNNIFLI